MSLENNLYLRSMEAKETIDMFDEKKLYGQREQPHYQRPLAPLGYSHAPDLAVGAFEKNYKANYTFRNWLGRKIWAIPLAAYDVTLRSICRLFVVFWCLSTKLCGFSSGCGTTTSQFFHIGKNFQLAGGRLIGLLWSDRIGMKIVDRTLIDKRFYNIYNDRHCSWHKDEHHPSQEQFFLECFYSQLNNLHDAEGSSLENALSYLQQFNLYNGGNKKLSVEKFLTIFFYDKIFVNYGYQKDEIEKKNRLIKTYKDLMEIFLYTQFDCLYGEEGFFMKLRKNIIHHHSTLIEGENEKKYRDQTEANKILLEICDIPKINDVKIVKNAFLAREYLLQGMEKELIEVLTDTPAALWYQEKFTEEMTLKLLAEKPELLPRILFKREKCLVPRGETDMEKNLFYTFHLYPIGDSLATNEKFIYFLLLTNPKLLDINTDGCENEILINIIDTKRVEIENAIEDLRKPLVETNGKIENFKGINALVKDNGEASKEYLKKFWFIAGVAKINPNIICHVIDEDLKEAFKGTLVYKKAVIGNMKLISKSFKKENQILPERLLRLILAYNL